MQFRGGEWGGKRGGGPVRVEVAVCHVEGRISLYFNTYRSTAKHEKCVCEPEVREI